MGIDITSSAVRDDDVLASAERVIQAVLGHEPLYQYARVAEAGPARDEGTGGRQAPRPVRHSFDFSERAVVSRSGPASVAAWPGPPGARAGWRTEPDSKELLQRRAAGGRG